MTTIDNATLDKLLQGVNPSDPQSMFSDAGLFWQLKKALAERMLQAELNHHLEEQRGAATPTRNHKNGSSKKTVLTTEARLALDIPRDRDGSFEPQLIAQYPLFLHCNYSRRTVERRSTVEALCPEMCR